MIIPFNWRILFTLLGLWINLPAVQAGMVVTGWTPIFKGIEHAAGTNFADATIPRLQAVHCLRIDLTDPDLRLFPTPRALNYIAGSSETSALSVSNFMRIYGLQVASDANFYDTSQGSDPSTEGIAANVHGLLVTTGQVVSAVGDSRYASLLFRTNNEPVIVFNNTPPGTNLTGIYNAISGYYPLVSNGLNIADAIIPSYPDSYIHQPQPRTAFAISQDNRYLLMMTIDGRQSGYSDGALDSETAIWLLRFGAWNGINMDGGGSTAMYSSDCAGNPTPLNHSSYVAGRNRERIIGAHFGIYALPLSSFIFGITNTPGSTTATINWTTLSNATSQVEYGTTTNFGMLSLLDTTPVTAHSVTLSGLSAGVRYYFRVLSEAGGLQYSSSCGVNSFSTTNVGVTLAFDLTNEWKYSFANLDGVNWQAVNYDDTAWSQGPGVLWADSRTGNPPSPNADQIPNYYTGQRMPIDPIADYPYLTYYFRTRFVFPGPVAGATLIFSNYIDDGAVFYLNGAELYRANMPAGPILNSTTASPNPCPTGNATCPMVFSLADSALGSLVVGTNVLAVEAHNQVPNSPDVTFESALFYAVPPPTEIITNLNVAPGETNATITWNTTTSATTQLQYGLTPALSSSNALSATLVTSHSVLLTGLQPRTTYYFRALSTASGTAFFDEGSFTTTEFLVPVITPANIWKYTTNNLADVDWTAPNYDDSAWLGQGTPLLYIEDNQAVSPLTTPLPSGSDGLPYPTYYFRTHFNFSGPVAGFALLFTNFVDDGAVFYLNGAEIQRLRIPAGSIDYTTLANGCPVNNCEATLDVPDVFRVGGSALTNLVLGGDNVLAAEVHQIQVGDSDVVFGSTAALVRAQAGETQLQISRTSNGVCLSWEGQFMTLQRASALSGQGWADVPGPVKASPYCVPNPPSTTFYRLRD